MTSAIRKRLHRLVRALSQPRGQDLVEYALVIGLLALGTIAGVNSLAAGLNTAFSNLGNYLVNVTS
jgi:Flp pilus assembly pilin Flp